MILAIECDGATYHSSATARDRDRLRQEHLEKLGWTFHRIWSQDWFYHREEEVARAVAAYDSAVAASNRSDVPRILEPQPEPDLASASSADPTSASGVDLAFAPSADPASASSIGPAAPASAPSRVGECPIRTRRPAIADYTLSELVTLIRWIESDTLLRTEEDLLAEATRTLGFRRRGSTITATLQRAMTQARRG
jgi:hypothetical protein